MKKIVEWLFLDYALDLYQQKEFKKITRFFIYIFLAAYILLTILCIIMKWHLNLVNTSIGVGLMIISLILFQKEYQGLAILVSLISMFFSATFSLVVGFSIYEVSYSAYFVIMALACLTVRRWSYIFLYVLTVSTLSVITWLTTKGLITSINPKDLIGDAIVIISIFTVFSIIMRILANNIKFYQKQMVQREIVIKEKDKEIAVSREKIHYLYDHLQDIYFECDLSGIILSVSPQIAHILQYEPLGLQGSRIQNIIVQSNQIEEIISILKTSHKITNFELEVFARDNSRHILQINASKISRMDDRIIIAGTAEDITEKKYINEKLSQLQKLDSLGRMAGTMAHDFNNLITIIGVNAELLLKKVENQHPKNLKENILTISEASKKASQVTRQVLDFSRAQELKLTSLDINQIIDDFLRFSSKIIPDSLAVHTHLQNNLPLIKADRNQIEQVLMNLLLNARDAFTENHAPLKKNHIEIKTSRIKLLHKMMIPHLRLEKGDYILIQFSDTGIGMNAEQLLHIFEPFYSTKGSQGTGLGLSSVYGIVRQSGGDIVVDSQPGKGSTFAIYWPVEKD